MQQVADESVDEIDLASSEERRSGEKRKGKERFNVVVESPKFVSQDKEIN